MTEDRTKSRLTVTARGNLRGLFKHHGELITAQVIGISDIDKNDGATWIICTNTIQKTTQEYKP